MENLEKLEYQNIKSVQSTVYSGKCISWQFHIGTVKFDNKVFKQNK